jgi:type III restriction enzyme
MEIKFDSQLDHQVAAVEAVADLFIGQRRNEIAPIFQSLTNGGVAAVANQISLDEDTLLTNLQAVQARNLVDSAGNPLRPPDAELLTLAGQVTAPEGPQSHHFYNFSVEMETGTGKTYVYIRTALELFRRYGFRKFIIVVPSVAIREGVLKTFQMTRRHFATMFGNIPYRYAAYDSANLSQVRQFALSDSAEFLIMTLAAFNKADVNVVYQSRDQLQGETPIHLLQAARPILILDEPQNMESEGSVAALAGLMPLFALRYSATHRHLYNLVYRLTPRDAYRQGLVKKIEVAAVVSENNINRPYIFLSSVDSQKNRVTARMTIHKLFRSGQIKESAVTVRAEDTLREKSGERPEYDGYMIEEINVGLRWVRFTNGQTIRVGEEIGADKEAVFQAQIQTTVEEHLRRQGALRAAGIKVLSLFFIDRVDNYQGEEALIRRLFDRTFESLKATEPAWKKRSAEEVRAAYFAQKRSRDGSVELLDTKTGEAQTDRDAYDLIMRDKERLLSLDEPVSFIFSHSALREGWDNPNVFQICTLNQSVSDIRKRQEIGRGVRICVNQHGERVYHDGVNVLTVIANESYETFVQQYQSEIDAAYREQIEKRFGKSIERLSPGERAAVEKELQIALPPPPKNARERVFPSLERAVRRSPLAKQEHQLADGNTYELPVEFVQLWEQINHKTRYRVNIDSQKLISDVIAELRHRPIPRPHVSMKKARVEVDLAGDFQALQTSMARTLNDLRGNYPLPNVVEIMMNLMAHTSPPMRLTRATLLEIVKCAPDPEAVIENPNGFATTAVQVIKEKLADQLIDGIVYRPTGEFYELSRFEPTLSSYREYAVPATKSLYDQIVCDSQVEKDFVIGLENMEDIKFFVKLPDWFKVETPIGGYNPDWAVVRPDPNKPDQNLLYLVAETKGQTDVSKLQYVHEPRKIKCGRAHFDGALRVPYRVLASVADLSLQSFQLEQAQDQE